MHDDFYSSSSARKELAELIPPQNEPNPSEWPIPNACDGVKQAKSLERREDLPGFQAEKVKW